ncbi:OTU domain-containing protein 3 [Zancudomyces culisetae]|uniref:OTU domain-containing protein 3 n=1 Tax=Zancudomyces culisetae TaxID=1213189 RepID=A0A1R1PLL6_ZANCU|nr:OTU domain-containing protein 3 [Zancudomyces culisetae]|eukprot:OMH81868.1 OTU domain-containing protein 3 [Zancudomyces culisetae]
MKKRGVYGGNLELVAFARCFDVDIKVYQAGGTVFLIDGSSNGGNGGSGTNRLAKRRQLHIAYHDYEHYSSIREKEDTGDGIPEFKNESMSMNQQFSSSGGGGSINMMLLSEENRKKMKSKVKIVIQATDLTSEEVATNLLIKHNWDVDSVIDEVYMSSISNENGIAGEKNEHEEELEPESEQHQKNENQGSGIGDKVGLDADIDKKNPKKSDSKEKEKEKERAIVTEKGMRRQKDKKNKTAKTIQEPTNTEGANVKNNKKEHTAQGHQSGYVSNRQKKIEAKRRQKEQSRIKKTQGKKNTALDGMRADKGGEKESDVTGKLTLLHI